jgi:predicted dehydrogenase
MGFRRNGDLTGRLFSALPPSQENEMTRTKRLRMGIVGPGFIATHHVEAVRRLGNVDVIAIAGSSLESARRKAALLHIDRAYGSWQELIADPDIDVVHNTTPSYLHFPISLASLQAGKHVVSDKPLALDSKECRQLCHAAEAAGLANAVTFNYRGNPMVQQMRTMISQGALGQQAFVHGYYLQDWMTDDHVYSWRSDPAKGGRSSALADIGSHWCDLAEHVSGARITAVLAELTTVVPTRYSAGGSVEAFADTNGAKGTPIHVEGEDLATVLLRWENGARGTFTVGQVLPGHKNNLQLEINGRIASLSWNQERQNELWMGRHDAPTTMFTKDPARLLPEAQAYTHLPAGHQEGWASAFTNVIADIYAWIGKGGKPGDEGPTVCTFAQATRTVGLIEAILESHAHGGVWVETQNFKPLEAAQ